MLCIDEKAQLPAHKKTNHLLALPHYNVPEAPCMKTTVAHRPATGKNPIRTYAHTYMAHGLLGVVSKMAKLSDVQMATHL